MNFFPDGKKRLRVLDLFCGAGGAARGILQACSAVELIGIDNVHQEGYPGVFVKGDVGDLSVGEIQSLADFVWASPPCQAFSVATPSARAGVHSSAMLHRTRGILRMAGVPFVIENVPGAPLRKDLVLCGSMFGLRLIRHRVFELGGWFTLNPGHPSRCRGSVSRGEAVTVAGTASSRSRTWRDAMGLPDVVGESALANAVPPAYSRWIFSQWLDQAGSAIGKSFPAAEVSLPAAPGMVA